MQYHSFPGGWGGQCISVSARPVLKKGKRETKMLCLSAFALLWHTSFKIKKINNLDSRESFSNFVSKLIGHEEKQTESQEHIVIDVRNK